MMLGQSDESSEEERPPRRKRKPLSLLLDSGKKEKRAKHLIEPVPALEVAMSIAPVPFLEVPEKMVLVIEEAAAVAVLIPEEMVIIPEEAATAVLIEDFPLFGVANIAEMGAVDSDEMPENSSGEEAVLDETAMKLCAKCGQLKSLSNFSRNKKYISKRTNVSKRSRIFMNTCKACRR